MNEKQALLIELLSLHPVIVWGLIIIDGILCAGEFLSLGLSYALSIIISIIFGFFTFFVQTGCGDDFGTAFSKSVVVCLIMLTPLSILSLLYMVLYNSRNQKIR